MKALVLYGTRFGTTGLVAKALHDGLVGAGIEVTLSTIDQFPAESFSQYDLLCIGAPTEAFSAYKPMKDYLGEVKASGLVGILGFAFDTKIDSRFSGSAAKYIEGILTQLGAELVAPRESAIVSTQRKGGITGAVLRDGEEARFRAIGSRLGSTALKARPMAHPA